MNIIQVDVEGLGALGRSAAQASATVGANPAPDVVAAPWQATVAAVGAIRADVTATSVELGTRLTSLSVATFGAAHGLSAAEAQNAARIREVAE